MYLYVYIDVHIYVHVPTPMHVYMHVHVSVLLYRLIHLVSHACPTLEDIGIDDFPHGHFFVKQVWEPLVGDAVVAASAGLGSALVGKLQLHSEVSVTPPVKGR